ncbi:MAG: hypothetical protein G01um101456_630 [Parcubacteria group bacterium Gr01-1014_56]|nr:MAG: hypothetical protein G01um101456_630 [Parcubacteria group bacterium Gr01-1014_56]
MVLWLVIIAAPLALVLYAIPNKTAESYFKQWLNALITYSLYPAIFLFLFIIIADFASALAVCSDAARAAGCTPSVVGAIFSDINNNGDATGITYLASIAANVGIRLGFIMLLLYLALQASSTVSKWGGDLAQTITARPDKWAASLSGFSRRFSTAGANFGYRNTAGRAATRLDKSLRTGLLSGIANSKWLNNPVLGHPAAALSTGVLQPVAGVSIGGGLSRVAYDKQYAEREKERATNRRTAENVPAMKELKGLIDKGTLSPAEEARKSMLQKRVDNFSKQELEAMKVDDLIGHASVFKEAGAKKIAEIEKFSEQKKQDFREAYEKDGLDTVGKKIDKEVKLLKEIRDRLKFGGGFSSDVLDAHTKTGSTVDLKTIKDMRDDIMWGVAVSRDQSRDRNSLPIDRRLAEKNALQLQQALKHLDTIEDGLSKLPEKKITI